MVRTCGKREMEIYKKNNENMEDRSEWTTKYYRKTKTEVERCYAKNKKVIGVQREETRNRRTWRMKTRCAGPNYKWGNGRRSFLKSDHACNNIVSNYNLS